MGQEGCDSYGEARKRMKVQVPDEIRLVAMPVPNAMQITVGTEKLDDFSKILALLVELNVEILEIKPVHVDKR